MLPNEPYAPASPLHETSPSVASLAGAQLAGRHLSTPASSIGWPRGAHPPTTRAPLGRRRDHTACPERRHAKSTALHRSDQRTGTDRDRLRIGQASSVT